MCGIYKITNLINKKVYIGQSICIEKRWIRHKNTYSNPNSNCYNYPLYKAFRKYGIQNFSFEVLQECKKEELNDREIYWIKENKSNIKEYGYNQTTGGSHATPMKLKEIEVKQIINLLKNSSLSQQEIANIFNVSQRTISGIYLGETWRYDEEKYPIIRKYKIVNLCVDCGREISKTSIRCISCNSKLFRKSERPDRETLKKLIREKSFVEIGKQFNVSDNAIRKWCDSYGLPRKKSEIKKYTTKEWNDI